MSCPQSASVLIQLVSAARELAGSSRSPFVVALDGRSGAGKTALARSVAEQLTAAIVPMDDFYAGGDDEWWLSLGARERADRVVDWRRLRTAALEPLRIRKQAVWHPLDFDRDLGWVGWKDETVSVDPSEVVLLEGAYSGRAELADLIDVAVLVEAPDMIRRERILEREGERLARRWHAIWDDAEGVYFGEIRPRTSFDLVVQGH